LVESNDDSGVVCNDGVLHAFQELAHLRIQSYGFPLRQRVRRIGMEKTGRMPDFALSHVLHWTIEPGIIRRRCVLGGGAGLGIGPGV